MKSNNSLMAVCLFLLFFLSACTLTRETGPTPNPDLAVVDAPGDIEPPLAVLAIAGNKQISGIGSFCWNGNSPDSGTVALCADTIGVPTALEPLTVFSPFTAQFRLPAADSPQQLSLTITPITEENELAAAPDQWRWWSYGNGTQRALPLEQEPAIELSLDPGLYLFSLFA